MGSSDSISEFILRLALSPPPTTPLEIGTFLQRLRVIMVIAGATGKTDLFTKEVLWGLVGKLPLVRQIHFNSYMRNRPKCQDLFSILSQYSEEESTDLKSLGNRFPGMPNINFTLEDPEVEKKHKREASSSNKSGNHHGRTVVFISKGKRHFR